jgi:hypothetical protein
MTAALVVAALSLAPAAALAGTLDQQQTDTSGGPHVINSTLSQAQTFTAGLSGGVDRVDLYLDAAPTTSGPLSVEIRDVVSGGAPGSIVLASQSVPATSVPSLAVFESINFATPAPVVAGTQYAIVGYTADTTGSYRWGTSMTDTYAGGGPFHAPAPSGTWTSGIAGYDFAFLTYVGPAPGPTGRRAAALKKCKKKFPKGPKRKKCIKKAKRLPV